MEEKTIRIYAKMMQELGLSALELEEHGCRLRLERNDVVQTATVVQVPSAPNATQTAASAQPVNQEDYLDIGSPMVGVFYRSPAENAAPFVNVGDRVRKGDVLCIIEAMKLMNEITSDYDGVITEVCAGNGQVVDFGHVLFRLKKE